MRPLLLSVSAMALSAYFAVGSYLAWMIWPLMADRPTAERVGYATQIVTTWPKWAGQARAGAASVTNQPAKAGDAAQVVQPIREEP